MTILDPEAMSGLRKGVEEFNCGQFFECHDTLEDVWNGVRGPARDFLQGLIQVAVGFYHLGNGNQRGGESQLEKGLSKLSGYGDSYLGLELSQLRIEVKSWLDKVRAGEKLQASRTDFPKYHFLS